jgi:hypothetical protein
MVIDFLRYEMGIRNSWRFRDKMNEWLGKMSGWIKENQLLSVNYLKTKQGPCSFSGRLLKVNGDYMLFYVDDTKQVINLHMNQIDHIEPFQ